MMLYLAGTINYLHDETRRKLYIKQQLNTYLLRYRCVKEYIKSSNLDLSTQS